MVFSILFTAPVVTNFIIPPVYAQICPSGTDFDSGLGLCTTTPTLSCTIGSFDSGLGVCVVNPILGFCPAGTSLNQGLFGSSCTIPGTIVCPAGTDF